MSKIWKLPKELEARVGIEPTHKGFADLSLTAWVPRLGQMILLQQAVMMPICVGGFEMRRDRS